MAKPEMTAPMLQAAALLADGHDLKDIVTVLWGVTKDGDRAAFERGYRKLRKWQADPKWQEAYQRMLKSSVAPLVGRAVRKIGEQIDHSNPWVAQGAAREVLSRFGTAALGEDDKSVTVRVEGMPTLGVPGAEGKNES